MSTGTYTPYPRFQVFDNSGDPLASGSLETYLAGTTTPVETYSDVSLSSANPTTLTLNSAGVPEVTGTEVAVFLTPGISYKFIAKNSAGSTIWTRDNISAVPQSSGDVDIDGTAGEDLEAGEVVYLSDGSGSLTAGRWYLADADLAYASTLPEIGIVPADIDSGESGSIRLVGRVTGLSGLTAGTAYYVSATAGALTSTAPGLARVVGGAESTSVLVLGPQMPLRARDLAVCEGRLTLTSGTPVTTADVTGAATLYFTPLQRGNHVALYTGAVWVDHVLAELSIALSGGTASKPHDVFLDYNDGTPQLAILAWTNDTTRATALTTQNGIAVKTGDTQQRYLGTVYLDGSKQCADSFAKRHVWNAYHRVDRPMRVLESTDSWTYTTATRRQANGNTANQLDIVVGLAEDGIAVDVVAASAHSAGSVFRTVGIGEDSTSSYATGNLSDFYSAATQNGHRARLNTIPAIGKHIYTWLEYSEASGTTTWYGDFGGSHFMQSGIAGSWRA